MSSISENKKDLKSISKKKQKDISQNINNVQLRNYYLATSKKGFELYKKDNTEKACSSPFLISVLPKLFQKAFLRLFSDHFPYFNDQVIIHNGSLSGDNIIYDYIDNIESTNQLPEIMLTSDYNSVYHLDFLRIFDAEEHLYPTKPFHSSRFSPRDYSKIIKVLAYDTLVMVIRKSAFANCSKPREWYELLNPKLKQKIVLPGKRDYFCNAFYLPFIERFGLPSIEYLNKNTKGWYHPEEMLWMIDNNNYPEVSIFVMPFSYAKNIDNNLDYEILIPNDGEIGIPIQLITKKEAYQKHCSIIDFLTGKELAMEFEKYGYYTNTHTLNSNSKNRKIYTVDWEFLQTIDLKHLKDKINSLTE